MNYIELARAVRLRLGIQGSGPASVDTTIPIERQILAAVRDVYLDIQNYEIDWKWLRSTASFSVAAGTTTYTLATILQPGYRFARWNTDTFYLTVSEKKTPLFFLDYDYFQYKYNNVTDQGRFSEFTVLPSTNSIIVPPPDGIYNITADYQKSPQTLSSATDTPEMPTRYHNLIVYGACEAMGVSVASQEQQQYNSQKYAEGMGQLLRSQNPRKYMRMNPIV